MIIEPKLTLTVEAALIAVRKKYLEEHQIWLGKFFSLIANEKDPKIVAAFLKEWFLQMPHASYGFTTYVSHLMANTQNEAIRYLLASNIREELGFLPGENPVSKIIAHLRTKTEDHALLAELNRLEDKHKNDRIGTDHYPQLSHFQMICNANIVIGNHKHLIDLGIATPEDFEDHHNPFKYRKFQWQDHKRLLPTCRAHVANHTSLCSNKDLFIQGLGAIFLIENLTAIEFLKILEAGRRIWAESGEPGPNIFDKGGAAYNYLMANMEADGMVIEGQPFAGHSLEAAFMLQMDMETRGVNINDPIDVAAYVEEVIKGMNMSITCRQAFVDDGVYANTERMINGLPSMGMRTEYASLRIPRPGGAYFITELSKGEIEVSRGDNTIIFSVYKDGAHPHRDDLREVPREIIPLVRIRLNGEDRGLIDLETCNNDIAALALDYTTVAANSNLSARHKLLFESLSKQIPNLGKQ